MKCSKQFRVLARWAALAACAGNGPAALAQSSLTLYGLADSYIEYRSNARPAAGSSSSGGSSLRMNSGGLAGSRWGMRGVEDLGGGMQAVFALESGFYMHTGAMGEAGRPFNRQAFLGLNGPYGMLSFGRQYVSMFDLLPAFMPLTYAGAYEPMPFLMGNLRLDNSVKYRVGTGPLAAQAHYQLDDAAGAPYQRAAWGGGASYLSGPFGLAAVYDEAGGATAATASNRLRKLALAATYAPDPWRLTVGYRWAQDKTAQGNLNQRDDMWWIGLGYRISPVLRITAAFYYDDVKARAGAGNPPNARQYALQLVYGGLSKRTDLYAAAAYARNSALNFAPLATLPAGEDSQGAVALGIRHKF
jgi:predicted porin